MSDLIYPCAIVALVLVTFAVQVMRKTFDPFAPIWLFVVGYGQIYVIQAISYHEWALNVRGAELVASANFRAFWAIAWFFLVYFCSPGRVLSRCLPRPPARWSPTPVFLIGPVLFAWGLYCAVIVSRLTSGSTELTQEGMLLVSFPLVMLEAGILLIITGNQPGRRNAPMLAAGLAIVALFMLLWMFNGKRSLSLVALLTGVCAFYVSRARRPSFPVLAATAVVGAMAVGISISWRFYTQDASHSRSFGDFAAFIANFDPSRVLESLNVAERETTVEFASHETEEYGGFLLMLDTVPSKSAYDNFAPYLRVFTTFIPRILWPNKPLPGREQWISAWVAGSELPRDDTFTGPAIGILGAAQLNGGALATVIVMGGIALVCRASYEYFRRHAEVPWVQTWWVLTYYNAWFCTVGDDPLNWFYYNWGYTTMPPLALLWFVNGSLVGPAPEPSTARLGPQLA